MNNYSVGLEDNTPMLSHLIECRRRILHVLVWFAVLFTVFFYWSPMLFHVVVLPLLHTLPKDASLIATRMTTPLITPIKLAADAALVGTTPYALLHTWWFTSPGLYPHERKRLRWAMVSSVLLFLFGMGFAFYLVLPYMFSFFARAIPEGVNLMPDMGYTVDFITRILVIFGLCFQVPLVCCLLVRLQLVNLATLRKIRPYMIVIAFILGMLLTPPDVLSQIMLAIPLCLLYETGIVLSRFS